MKLRSVVLAGAVATGLVVAPAAQAVDTGVTNVAGTVGTELSLTLAAPAGALSLSHAAPAATTIPVTVTSTGASQTLQVADSPLVAFTNAGHTTGLMDQCTGTVSGGAITGLAPALTAGVLSSELGNPFQVSSDGSSWQALTQARNVASPALGVNSYNVHVQQSLADADNVTATNIYCITLGWTVS